MKLKQFIQQETVLTAAAVLAVVSAFFVPPDVQYIGYIDLRTLAILFSLMTVMAGLRRQGFFDGLGRALLSRTHSTFQLTLVLVGLCFFGSMFITNDVSLLTFVPFTFVVLSRLGAGVRRALLIPVVCMQTVAANLGSMLTPVGNPQNLFLYTISGMEMGEFFAVTVPYVGVSYFLLYVYCYFQGKQPLVTEKQEPKRNWSANDKTFLAVLGILFLLCLLAVFHVASHWVVFIIILMWFLFFQKGILKGLDYNLLLTFVFFFVLIGNLGRIPVIRETLQDLLFGRDVFVSFLAS